MKMLGLIGGMSWESSAEYYRIINQGVRDRCGPAASARCLLWSFNFAEIAALQAAGDWDALTAQLVDAAQRLEAAGADLLMICTNTMHKCAPEIEAAVYVPLLHIADPAAAAIKAAGHTTVGLLGTAFTMEQPFYTERLTEKHGLKVLVPEAEDRAEVHRVIYEELIAGRIEPASLTGRTGVEMEALTAVSVALLTVYDMAKAIDKAMVIDGVRLVEKRGGKSGDWRAP